MVVPAKRALEDIEPENEMWGKFYNLVQEIAKEVVQVRPMTIKEFIKTGTGRQKAVWSRAAQKDRVYDKEWMVYDGFVKVEKYSYYEKPNRVPRLILPPSDFAKVEMGRHIKPLDRAMKEIVLPGCVYPFVAKGMSSSELGERFFKMQSGFQDPVFISIDMSKCDSTIGARLKKGETMYYVNGQGTRCFERCMLAGHEESMYVRIAGKKIRVPQMRASGTAHTGGGNTLDVALVSRTIFTEKMEIYSNGDDTILIVEQVEHEAVVARIVGGCYSVFGFSVRIEQVTTELEDVFWCQCHLTFVAGKWQWIRDYKRVMQTILSNENYGHKNWLSYLTGIATGEGATNPGQPIISPLIEAVRKLGHKAMRTPNYNQTTRRWEAEGCPPPSELVLTVTDSMRALFFKRHGISPDEQLRIESKLVTDVASLQKGSPIRTKYYWTDRGHPFGTCI